MKPTLQQLPVYRKAIELYTLSRKLTAYLTDDKEFRRLYRSKDLNERDLEFMVIESLALAPGIALAEVSKNERRRLYLKHLTRSISLLRTRLRAIKSRNKNDHDYLDFFKRELHRFNIMVQEWSLSLLHKN